MLTISQEKALKSALNGENIFLTGSPGTGKSYLLRYIIALLKHKNVGITATTGCAAVNISGNTLHSYFGLKPNMDIKKYVRQLLTGKNFIKSKLEKLDILIIDEVSMLDDVLCNDISFILKECKKSTIEFGDVQVIFVGDFFQLPPVTNTFCFLSLSWINLKPKIVELKELVRQSDDKLFQLILGKLRFGKLTKQIYDILENNKTVEFKDIKPTKLYPNNVDVDKINLDELKKLTGKSNLFKSYYNRKEVNKYLLERLNNFNVFLCVGAQIIITRNINIDVGLVNGSRGVIVDLTENTCIIKTIKGNIHTISYYKHDLNDHKNLSIMFMPIKLAYAITIHKSQGSTIDYLEISLGSKIFECGQSYTALSRGKKLENIKIIDIHPMSFKANEKVLKWFDDNCKDL